MKLSTRTAIAAVAGSLALGTAGFAMASANADDVDRDPALKREDTTASWTVPAADDDDDNRDRDRDANTNLTQQTRGTAQTHQTVKTVKTAPTKNTNKTVNTAPTKNTEP